MHDTIITKQTGLDITAGQDQDGNRINYSDNVQGRH